MNDLEGYKTGSCEAREAITRTGLRIYRMPNLKHSQCQCDQRILSDF